MRLLPRWQQRAAPIAYNSYAVCRCGKQRCIGAPEICLYTCFAASTGKATQPTCLLRGSTTSTAMCPCLHVEPLFYNTAGSEDDKLPVIILRPHPAEGPVVKGRQGGLRWRRRAAIALLQLKFLAHAWVLLQLAHVHLHAKRNTHLSSAMSTAGQCKFGKLLKGYKLFAVQPL